MLENKSHTFVSLYTSKQDEQYYSVSVLEDLETDGNF